MLYLAVPRSIAAILVFEDEPALSALRRGKRVPNTALQHLENSLKSALRWSNSGRPAFDLAFVQIARASGANPQSKTSASALAKAEQSLVLGLSRSPINGDGWRWLAVVRTAHGNRRQKAVLALRQSFYTAPYVVYLATPRIRLSISLWDQLKKDDQEIVYRQIRFAWRVAEYQLLLTAKDSPSIIPFLVALSSQPKKLIRFQRQLSKMRARKP